MGERVWWPPRWAMLARRSLTFPAGAVLMEMFMQGTVVRQARASGGAEVVVWNGPLEELRACSSSMVHRAKVELLGRGFLVELPGHRMVNGRLFSSWMCPVELEEHHSISSDEHHSISSFAPDHHSKSSDARGVSDSGLGGEHHSISSFAPEHHSKSSGAESKTGSSRTRARAAKSTTTIGSTTTTTNEISAPETCPGPEEDGMAPIPAEAADRLGVALSGLRWSRVSNPERVVERFGVDRCLVALQALAGKFERNEHVGRPGGFVMTVLLSLEGVPVAPVEDVGFARWWLPAESAPNLVAFRRGGAR